MAKEKLENLSTLPAATREMLLMKYYSNAYESCYKSNEERKIKAAVKRFKACYSDIYRQPDNKPKKRKTKL